MEKPTIGRLLAWGKKELKSTALRTPALDAEVLLMEALKADRLVLHVYPEREVAKEQAETYRAWVRRRKDQEPLQYITGKKEFMGLDFYVEKGVLIPRGDTEVVVEAAIEELTALGGVNSLSGEESGREKETGRKAPSPGGLRALDIGVGSGAIAVSLLYYIKNLSMVGIDPSKTALKVTAVNGDKHGVSDRLTLLSGSLFEPVKASLPADKQRFDLVISNPPYIPYDVKESLDREVRDFEPEGALFADEAGLYYYREIAERAPEYINKGGLLIFEIGYDQGPGVQEIVRRAGFTEVRILQDLEKRDRVVIGKR